MLLKPDVRALAARDDSRALTRAAGHWSAAIRADSAAALGALRTSAAGPALVGLLTDSQSEVREAAARALGDIGSAEAIDPLIGALRAINGARNDRPGSREFEFEAITEALGMLDDPRGIAAVLESGTVCFREGSFSIGRPHVGGLCLSGGARARAALTDILGKHYLYEPYSLIGVVEALDYLSVTHVSASMMQILNSCVESLRTAWQVSSDPFLTSDRHVEALALATARALGRLDAKRAEPVLIDLLLRLPVRAFAVHGEMPAGVEERGQTVPEPLFPSGGVAFAEMRHAILTLRGEKSPAEFDCARSLLRLHKYRARRYKTDVEFGGEKRRTAR